MRLFFPSLSLSQIIFAWLSLLYYLRDWHRLPFPLRQTNIPELSPLAARERGSESWLAKESGRVKVSLGPGSALAEKGKKMVVWRG